jgi:hypothetical protein
MDLFCDHLVHFVFIWCIFSLFWYRGPRKMGQPCIWYMPASHTVWAKNSSFLSMFFSWFEKYFLGFSVFIYGFMAWKYFFRILNFSLAPSFPTPSATFQLSVIRWCDTPPARTTSGDELSFRNVALKFTWRIVVLKCPCSKCHLTNCRFEMFLLKLSFWYAIAQNAVWRSVILKFCWTKIHLSNCRFEMSLHICRK